MPHLRTSLHFLPCFRRPSFQFLSGILSVSDRTSSMESARKTLYNAGLQIRREVTGADHVQRSNENCTDFSRPVQELATEVGWGAIWSRPGLTRKERSLMTLALLTGLGKSQELGVHVKAAVNNRCSVKEIQEAIIHAACYAGLPCGLEGFRVAERVLKEMGLLNENGAVAKEKAKL